MSKAHLRARSSNNVQGEILKAELSGDRHLVFQLELLKLSPQQRQIALRVLGKRLINNAKSRIKQQRNIDGSGFAARRSQRTKRKMLRGLAKGLVLRADSNAATVTYANTLAGKIARAQQEGVGEIMTAAIMAQRDMRLKKVVTDTSPATAFQAAALIENGFVIRTAGAYEKGKGYIKGREKRASKLWIKRNLTMKKAGAILHSMRGVGLPKWLLTGTARSFLGLSSSDIDAMADSLLNETTQQALRA
jgi:hypothetical protein